ncbi:AraC-type DNA-binding protein [Dyadobacter psychrophilus]|uniref:AraC-type DNA-binding protein n=2 Tax=Dyadobacter psychrophilus TaxID=651661 RepID=A0A1T5GCB7_9BACT|nr:AraC-type DNA-binding protein [Dyadobacter psychrophilus]
MGAYVLNSSDILEFHNYPNPQYVGADHFATRGSDFTCFHETKVGTLRFKNALFPHMHVMDLRWSTNQELLLMGKDAGDNVNINFHMAGKLNTRFKGLNEELKMRPKTHNLVFSPTDGDINHVQANAELEMFHISFTKTFFADIIGCDDAWSEKVLSNLFFNRPFSGVAGTLEITPQMLLLIKRIRDCSATGPFRNLMIQSATLELLGHQINQFRSPKPVYNEIKADEADKLHELRSYLDAHFLDELSLSQLSRVCGLNDFKVKKGFKLLFGTTVFNYLRKKRMEYAENLLLNCSLSVEEVAHILGYEHAHHFSAAFKKHNNASPSKYKSNIFSAL